MKNITPENCVARQCETPEPKITFEQLKNLYDPEPSIEDNRNRIEEVLRRLFNLD